MPFWFTPTFSGPQLGNKTRAVCTDFNFNYWGIFDILNKHPVGWDFSYSCLLCLVSRGKSTSVMYALSVTIKIASPLWVRDNEFCLPRRVILIDVWDKIVV
jgi:hypothetical protein